MSPGPDAQGPGTQDAVKPTRPPEISWRQDTGAAHPLSSSGQAFQAGRWGTRLGLGHQPCDAVHVGLGWECGSDPSPPQHFPR